MNVMNCFTLRSMKSNRKWTAVTLIGIILSTAMIAAVSTFCASFLELMRQETIADTGNWHARITDVRMEEVSAVKNAKFEPEVSLGRDVGYALLEGAKNKDKPYLFLQEFNEDSYQNFPVQLTEGRMPQNDRELVLPEHLKTNGGIKVEIGDSLTLETGKRSSPNAPDEFGFDQSTPYQGQPIYEDGKFSMGETFVPERTEVYTVVGIMARPAFERISAPGYTAVTRLDESTLGPDDSVTVTVLAGKLNHGFFDDMTALVQRIGLDDSHIIYNKELLQYSGVVANDSAQNAIYGFAEIFLIIIMVASVSLIYNAFSISISERISQLGMLASVGATKRQKRHSVYFEGFLLGIVGIPLGILSGIAGIGITLSAIRPLLESFMNFSSGAGLSLHVSLLSVAAAALLAALTIFVSVWVPARRASKIMPIDAIRQSREVQLTRKAVKTSRLTHALFGIEGEIALKNLKRSRKKYRATVLSLTISLVLFLTVSYYTETMSRVNSVMDEGYNFDFAVSYMNADDEIQRVNQEITELEGVTAVAAMEKTAGDYPVENAKLSKLVRRVYGSDDRDDFTFRTTLYCFDDASFDRYVTGLGADPGEYRDPAHPKIILINYGQAYVNGKRTAGELLTSKPGDMLSFSYEDPFDENEEEPKLDLEIGLITKERPMGILVSSLDNIDAIVSRSVFDSLPDVLKSLDSDGRTNYQKLYLTCDNAGGLSTRIKEKVESVSGRTYVYSVAEEARSQHNLTQVLGIFIYGFITLISLICIANIFNTVTTNIALRRREFAMLRSVGMTPGSFNKMIRFESVFYGLKSLLFGIPISIAITLLLYRMEGDVFDMGFSLPWVSYIAAIVLIFVIVGATMLYSGAKVKKENIIEALKAE